MEPVAVVAVPFPAQGHLNQLLHLSLQLASRGGVDVHYAAPAAQLRQARARVHGWDDKALRSVRFHDLGISTYASPPPDPAAASPFPSHLMPLWEAYTAGAPAPLAALLDKLSASYRRVVVVYDRINDFAAQEAEHQRILRENGLTNITVEDCATEEFVDYIRRTRATKEMSPPRGILTNTCRALEGEFIDVVAGNLAADGKKVFAVGPLNPLLHGNASKQGDQRQRHECLDWLDKQPPASVLYVSFGTTSSLNQRFIWVLRDADRGDIFAEDSGEISSRHAKLLRKFTQHNEGSTGLVITGWAPQLEILAHDATAAFMSHCGWNSTMESLSHGKPILAWPMHCDQPWDAELLCKYLKAGVLVRPWEKHNEVTPAKDIQEAIEEAMLSDGGVAMQQRARELGDAIRASVAAAGSSVVAQRPG
uniref:Glycosyltransferase n=1 Tax=Oryza barthii TaxID=65489 RepID=A0A0D3FYS6_9ORYZ